MRNLHEDYTTAKAISAAYFTAKTANDQAGIEAARAARKALNEAVRAEGTEYKRIFGFYESAKERGNELIDLDDDFDELVRAEKVPAMMAAFKKYGIEAFTFTSTWSNSVETAWLIAQNGYNPTGMVEINGRYTDFEGGYEKVHGYLFRKA